MTQAYKCLINGEMITTNNTLDVVNPANESHSQHVLMSLVNLTRSNDFQEAINAYSDRRNPVFKGN